MMRIIFFNLIICIFSPSLSMDRYQRKKLIPISKIEFPSYMYQQFVQIDIAFIEKLIQINPNNSTKKITQAIHSLTKTFHTSKDSRSLEIAVLKNMKIYATLDALSYIEGVYLSHFTQFLSQENYLMQLLVIHTKLTRLTSQNAGKIREGKVWHRIKELTITEKIFQASLEKYCSKTKDKKLHTQALLPSIEHNCMRAQDIKDLLVIYELFPFLRPIPVISPKTISVDEVDEWIKQTGSIEKQTVNVSDWLKNRYQAQSILDELEIIPEIVNMHIHPIKKAALVWYHLLRINPFYEKNNLTSYLVAATLLIKHRYLPPELQAMDQLQQIFEDCCEKNDPKAFIHYVFKQVSDSNCKSKL